MSVVLSQSADAAFHAGLGLKIAMAEGTDGSYLTVLFDAEEQPLFLRFALRRGDMTEDAGKMRFLGGQDDADNPAWALEYDFATDEVLFLDNGTEPIFSVSWPAGWHVCGLMLETSRVRLWRNDELVHEEAGSFGAMQTRTFWMGGTLKEHALAGELHLDWLTMTNEQLANPMYYRLAGLRRVG